MPDRSLRAAYEAAVYEVCFPGGTRRFRVGERPDEPVEPFAIVTAWNPGHERPSQAGNDAANRALEGDIVAAGFRYLPSVAFEPAPERPEARTPVERRHPEPGFAIFGIELEAALALARAYRQAAILWYDGAVPAVRWC